MKLIDRSNFPNFTDDEVQKFKLQHVSDEELAMFQDWNATVERRKRSLSTYSKMVASGLRQYSPQEIAVLRDPQEIQDAQDQTMYMIFDLEMRMRAEVWTDGSPRYSEWEIFDHIRKVARGDM